MFRPVIKGAPRPRIERNVAMTQQRLTEYNSPLSREHAEQLSRLVDELRGDQLTWISGYLAGLNAAAAAGSTAAAQMPAEEPAPGAEITILYGSQTGNAEKIAERAGERAEARGFRATVLDMADVGKPRLKSAERMMVVVSTHGEGEPPDAAAELHELVQSKKAPPMKDARFAVLSLGDTSYEHFCQTGKDFDARLEALGGTRVHDRVDCDVDYDDAAEQWIEDALSALTSDIRDSGSSSNVVAFGPVSESEAPAATAYSRKNPFAAPLLTNLVLSGRGSDKETRHIELSVEDSGMSWQPGDSLAVLPENDPREIEDVLAATGLAAGDPVNGPRGEVELADALRHDYEITTLTRPFLQQWAELSDAAELRSLLGDDSKDALREWMWGRHIIDALQTWPATGLSAQQLIDALRKLPPRLYSIASSHAANPDEIHLTVAAVRYESHGRDRRGVASTWLADRVDEDATVPVYIDTNKNFRLPQDGDTPIIMVGPGTGVAPFRAFIEERETRGDAGRNWLFFGDRRFRTDFLYQKDWLRWREQGMLERINVAFSRDQREKVYVQDRLREQGGEIWQWLADGAHFYVCGDAEYMAPDVHQALIDIATTHGNMTAEEASAWLGQLQKDKRYQRDVY